MAEIFNFVKCQLANDVIHSLTTFRSIMISYLCQFVAEKFESLQKESPKCAPQYKLDIDIVFQTSPIFKALLATFGISFDIC